MTRTTTTVSMLLVDDDDVDVMAVKRMFRKQRIANPLFVAHNGQEALDLLRGPDPPQRPLIILLDINMPQMNGHEFLNELRGDPDLASIVVFMLTTSDDKRDKKAAYHHHVAGYIVKNKLGDGFMELLSLLTPYWRLVEMET